MADISAPTILMFDLSTDQGCMGKECQAEAIIKDVYIDFDEPYNGTTHVTFCVWYRIHPTAENGFKMEAYIQQKYILTPVDKISPQDLHKCAVACADRIQEMLRQLYREFRHAPIVVPMRYDEDYFGELVEKIQSHAFGAGFDFGSFFN